MASTSPSMILLSVACFAFFFARLQAVRSRALALRRSMILASRSLIILFVARFATFSARFASLCFAQLRAMRSRFLALRRSMMVASASIVARWMELVMGCFLGWGKVMGCCVWWLAKLHRSSHTNLPTQSVTHKWCMYLPTQSVTKGECNQFTRQISLQKVLLIFARGMPTNKRTTTTQSRELKSPQQ